MKMLNVISGGASTLFVASILTFGLSTGIASAHDPKPGQECKGHHTNDPDCLVVVPGGVTYTAERTTGVLSFGPVDVTPNGTESDLLPISGNPDLEFFRPGPSSNFANPNTNLCSIDPPTQEACQAWDAVIESCDHLVDIGRDGADVPRFKVSADNLSFTKIGGVRITYGGIDTFFDPYPGPEIDPFMGLNLSLIGDCFDGCTDDFIPSAGTSEKFELTHFWLTGHTVAKGKKGHCNKDGHEGDLAGPVTPGDPLLSDLVITASCQGGTLPTGSPPTCT